MTLKREDYLEFEMDLTGTCNLSCPLCTRNYSHADHTVYKDQRPLEDIIKQLDTFPNLERTFLAGQVSEPTLYKDFLNYLRYLKSRNIYIQLFTNGSTHEPKWWEEVGKILEASDEIHFTICGSTQELHEKYRVGSNLKKLMANVEGYRKTGKGNDYCQFINFEYNKHDYVNVQKMNFTHIYLIESEGVRSENEKKIEVPEGVAPTETRDKTIKWIFNNQPTEGVIKCKSLENKKLYINQSGRISACYIHYEYNPEDLFEGDSFDYADILDFKYQKCFVCEERTRFKIEKLGLDFVC
jgi:MoaA/NifB/PqqE/SkfB family radical SAM enzyme